MRYCKVCPKCGAIKISEIEDAYQCYWCGTDFIETKYVAKYPEKKDPDEFEKCAKMWEEKLDKEYVFSNPLFDKVEYNKRLEDEDFDNQVRKQNLCVNVKCPTCGGTIVRRLPEQVAFFGFVTKRSLSQFECLTCGYMW